MKSYARMISCAFVVCKLLINGKDYLLLRSDPEWNDLTFVGGHQSELDEGDLKRTAIRETEEEVPGLCARCDFTISPLTPELEYGPVWSYSALANTAYRVRFYHLRFQRLPNNIEGIVDSDRLNVLVPVDGLFSVENDTRKSQFVFLLEKQIPGGLKSVPYSWAGDLAAR